MKMLRWAGALALLHVAAAPALAAQDAAKASAKCPDEQALLDGKPGITMQERQKVRTATFDALDRDHDGVVSRSEYVDCLAESPAFDKTGKGVSAVKR